MIPKIWIFLSIRIWVSAIIRPSVLARKTSDSSQMFATSLLKVIRKTQQRIWISKSLKNSFFLLKRCKLRIFTRIESNLVYPLLMELRSSNIMLDSRFKTHYNLRLEIVSVSISTRLKDSKLLQLFRQGKVRGEIRQVVVLIHQIRTTKEQLMILWVLKITKSCFNTQLCWSVNSRSKVLAMSKFWFQEETSQKVKKKVVTKIRTRTKLIHIETTCRLIIAWPQKTAIWLIKLAK